MSNYNLKIVLEKGSLNKLRFIPYDLNNRKVSVFSSVLPHDLRDFLKRSSMYGLKEEHMLRFLSTSNPQYPFVFQFGKETKELFWNESTSYSLYYQFDVVDQRVNLVLISPEFGAISKINDSLLMSEEKSMFFPLTDAFHSCKKIGSVLSSFKITPETDENHPTLVAIPFFNQSYPSFEKHDVSSVRFTVNGDQVQPRVVESSVKIDVFDTQTGEYFIKPTCESASGKGPFDLTLIRELIDLPGIKSSFLTEDRLELIYDLLFQYLHKNVSMDDIDSQLNHTVLVSTQENIDMIKQCLADIAKMCDESVFRVSFLNKEWCLIDMNRKEQSYILLSLFDAFKSSALFSQEEKGFLVSKDVFNQKISLFASRLKEKNIDLLFNDKTLDTINWDVKISFADADNNPSFFINDTLVDIGKLKQAAQAPWFQLDDDHIQLIDESTRLKIQAILDVELIHRYTGKKKQAVSSHHKHISLLDWIALEKLGVNVSIPEPIRKAYDRLMALDAIKQYPIPNAVKLTPRQYQSSGYSWLCFLYEHYLGGVLADDMGLGKTFQAVMLLIAVKDGLLSRKNRKHRPHMIVVPPSLVFNWKNEIEKVSDALSINVYTGSGRSLKEPSDIIITTYDTVRLDVKKLESFEVDILIVDEAQMVKNQDAARTMAIQSLKSSFVLCLTGTPLENHLGEYFTILNLALPGIFMPDERIEDHYSILLKRAAPFVLRRLKDSIFDELPPKQEIDVYLEFSDAYSTFYKSLLREIRQKVKDAYKDNDKRIARATALTALLRLRQACISPKLLGVELDDLPPKYKYLLQKLEELHEEGHSCLVFSQFTSSLDLIEPLLKEKNLNYVRLDGKTSVKKRKEIVESFQASEKPLVFLMSLKAGGVGLNLTRASYVFHLDPWWNPAAERQASDRAHRIGQTQTVMILHLVMKDSIEEKIMSLKQDKIKLFEDVFSHQENRKTGLSKEDFEFLLS